MAYVRGDHWRNALALRICNLTLRHIGKQPPVRRICWRGAHCPCGCPPCTPTRTVK